MAKVDSLGVHTPAALPYLISEGILPPHPKRTQYQWETFVYHNGQEDVEEEILSTKNAVAWSQGRFLRHVYRFELEGEDVVQALLTNFPTAKYMNAADKLCKNNSGCRVLGAPIEATPNHSYRSVAKLQRGSLPDKKQVNQHHGSSRALVVILKTKAHIYFVQGSSYIIDLPFEVEKAFASSRGVVLQKKPSSALTVPPTPQIPPPPHNSFLSSQLFPSQRSQPSFLESPILARSFARPHPLRSSSSHPASNGKLESLFQDILRSSPRVEEEDLASLYSLTGPLSDLGVVSCSVQHQRPRTFGKAHSGLNVEFEPIDRSEELVYISKRDELVQRLQDDHGELNLVVTVNHDLRAINIWHAWYIEEKPLAALLTQRAAHKAAKLRRRSSFLSGSIGTGATTPVARPREHTRESFAGVGSMRLAADTKHTTSRKPTKQEEEAAMASQMDPDYQRVPSQPPARESRRISSINADMRSSQNLANPSFTAAGSRRNTSFGTHDRRSFGHRKSRGSTPGSVFSRSIGLDDDSMEWDSTTGFDDEENVEGIIRHIRATYEAAGTENVFGGVEDGFRCELVVRKLHTLPMPSSSPSKSSTAANRVTKVITLFDQSSITSKSDDQRLHIFIHSENGKDAIGVKLAVKQRSLWPEFADSEKVAIPVVINESTIGKCSDIAKLKDGMSEAVLLSERALLLPTDNDGRGLGLPKSGYREFSQFSNDIDKDANQVVGQDGGIPAPRGPLKLTHSGTRGKYDEVGRDEVFHRRWMQLRPVEEYVETLLDVCQAVLPPRQAAGIRSFWCRSHAWLVENPEMMSNTTCSMEWVALVATIFSNTTSLLDVKAKSSISLTRLATGKHRARQTSVIRAVSQQGATQLVSKAAWNWMDSFACSPLALQSATKAQRGSLDNRKDQLLPIAVALAHDISESLRGDRAAPELGDTTKTAVKIMLALHIFQEEQKLSGLCASRSQHAQLAPIIAQLGCWLALNPWSQIPDTYYGIEAASEDRWAFVQSSLRRPPQLQLMEEPLSVFQWFEMALQGKSLEPFPSLDAISKLDSTFALPYTSENLLAKFTPRCAALSEILIASAGLITTPTTTVEMMAKHGINTEMLETLPEAIAAPLMEATARCERQPPTTWSNELLRLVGRDDLELESDEQSGVSSRPQTAILSAPRDVQTICHAIEHTTHAARTREANRHAVSQLIFREDRRLIQATSLMHFNSVQIAECPKQPDWTDAHHFEQQRRVMQWVTLRMIALPAGDGMLHFDSQSPLLTEKYHLPGFNSSCLVQPMGHTLTTDRSGLTEEKVNWAYFHAGVSSGLRISRNVKGIDTSWIAFNKPNELTNRHAGLLLALGLNGHLKSLAKWLSFKYLTPKHNMTSVGLLLGLSVSYIGTMDTLITRMLSVHITRMLPPGAAELNVSPVTQTAGLMGIGMLYYNTQHRRMSEIMLSEIERLDIEDPDSGPDQLRDESYRLSAGFALGLINLGKGRALRGLHGMQLPERLLAIAVGSRPVGSVHVFDRAPAGAIVALALVYMKSGDSSFARKVDIPDTEAQYDHVRPDMLLLRAMAKHVILWDTMNELPNKNSGQASWIEKNLPICFAGKMQAINESKGRYPAQTSDVPFYNIATGLAWALSLRYAGSGNTTARDEILALLDCLQVVKGGDVFFYDAKLARATIRRCIDVLALSAATVMAGTGDLWTMRYLRRLHGRTDAETPYGSHLAAHLAIGVLFLGGGTYTLGTSDLAIASLMCAFYPLFPIDVHDNRVHLQAFRHLWVLAAEARCLVVEDIDTRRPISMPIKLVLRNGDVRSLMSPCLLPELDTIATVQTADSTFWRVTLDFASNPAHSASFRANQRIFVRRCPATEAHSSPFAATLAALNDTQAIAHRAAREQIWHAIFTLPAFRTLDKADVELVLPPSTDIRATASAQADERRTVVDDRLVLASGIQSTERDALWNLRMLFAWMEKAREIGDGPVDLKWIGGEVVAALEARIVSRTRKP
ncbi:negative regulator of mitosis [Acrodontium crateriforme]|uniref:Negative regulator of mitosis n=1 Tax=Acrodontium crateriforme TaxID=150365 RepID=A0AAQ3LWS2_9PEZI|nr:negative regulator of mitosis [Acrodontium crateriforme]